MSTTIAQSYFQEGWAVGFAEGQLIGIRKLVIRQAIRRFGIPNPRHLSELEHIADFDELDRLTDLVPTVDSWNELLDERRFRP